MFAGVFGMPALAALDQAPGVDTQSAHSGSGASSAQARLVVRWARPDANLSFAVSLSRFKPVCGCLCTQGQEYRPRPSPVLTPDFARVLQQSRGPLGPLYLYAFSCRIRSLRAAFRACFDFFFWFRCSRIVQHQVRHQPA